MQFVIKDSGRCIPPADLPHPFERFYRVDKSRARARGGCGNGLTISKHIVEAHGGRIWAKSEQGQSHMLPEAPALNETEHAWHYPDGQIQELIKNGGKVMPSLGDQLTDEQIVAVIRYIQTWWTPDQLRQQQARSLQYPLQQ